MWQACGLLGELAMGNPLIDFGDQRTDMILTLQDGTKYRCSGLIRRENPALSDPNFTESGEMTLNLTFEAEYRQLRWYERLWRWIRRRS